jgi:hypothetical protein
MAVGALVVVVGTLLPWVRTGEASRNSYDVFALLDRLGISPGELVGRGLRFWPLVPLLVIAAAVLAWWGWVAVGAATGILGGIYAGGVAIAVMNTDAVTVAIRPGATITLVGGLVLLVGSFAALVLGARRPA